MASGWGSPATGGAPAVVAPQNTQREREEESEERERGERILKKGMAVGKCPERRRRGKKKKRRKEKKRI